MNALSQLVFYGEVLPGHEPEAVKTKLAELLKLPANQISTVFSGRKIVLRKSLPSEQAASYITRLELIGVKAFAEPLPLSGTEVSAVLSATTTAPAAQPESAVVAIPPNRVLEVASLSAATTVVEPPVAPIVQALAIDEVDCPKCGEHQPKRTLCRACSVDMKRFAEAKQQAEQEAREERLLQREIASAGRSGSRHANVSGDASESVFGFGFSGRLGRRHYLVGNLLTWALMGFAVVALIKLGMLIALLFLALSIFISLRLSILRCHDSNWSGWPTLIFFIPYVGPLFGLVLMFMPGTKGDNNYGSPSPSPGFIMGFAVVALFALSAGILYKQQDAFLAYAVNQTMGSAAKYAGKGGGSAVHSLVDADVEMFTTTDCGVCHAAKAYMNRRGIKYVEKNVEQNEDFLRDFYARGGRGVPYIFVGNQSMSGFDPNRLESMLDSPH